MAYAIIEERTNPGSYHSTLTHLVNQNNVPSERVNHKIDNVLPVTAKTFDCLLDHPLMTCTLDEQRLTSNSPDPNHSPTQGSPAPQALPVPQATNHTLHTRPGHFNPPRLGEWSSNHVLNSRGES